MPFQGEVHGTSFTIRRITHYTNSFLPVIVGHVETRPEGGSALVAAMRLSRPTAIFMGLWLGGVVVIGTPLTIASLRTPPFTLLDLIPGLMLLAGAGVAVGGFVSEAGIARRILERVAAPSVPEPVSSAAHYP